MTSRGATTASTLPTAAASQNLSTGTISGANDGIYVTGGTVTNAGAIAGTTDGIDFADGGSVVNQVGGTISGASNGIYLHNAGTVTNAAPSRRPPSMALC